MYIIKSGELESLRAINKRFRDALEAYANSDNWGYRNEWLGLDPGESLAQEALNPKPEPPTYEDLQKENERLKDELAKTRNERDCQ